MKRARELILEALENLTEDEFKKFKLKLRMLELREGFNAIPRGILEPLDRMDLSEKIVSCYLEDYGLELTAEVLRKMGMLEEAVKLQQTGSHLVGNAAQSRQHSTATSTVSGIHFVEKHRKSLINRITSVDAILDHLLGNVLSQEEYEAVRAENTNQNKMRKLFSFMVAWDESCKDQLLEALKELHPYLVQELERSRGAPQGTL
ncbi:apoptosis-associated speck-like protein containing a CARD isoform X2 [Gracilinanus agilis]|uniref:apoptosis-associated speck-like protein containing a CARD isoform X2 n=1 Tax=Gracilinanus agilis TaxID=191870 RepID=UPI001CFC6298|nr:apoptosis-associated speck-like protein containing a CARD isoform X2 [Gracilinanus agilis]